MRMWLIEVGAALLWLWAIVDYLSRVDVHMFNHTIKFNAGIMYDTSSGNRAVVECTGPCKSHCNAAKWTAAIAFVILCITVPASFKKWRMAAVTRVGALVFTVATIALETHMAKDECTPRNLDTNAIMTTSFMRGRIPLIATAVLLATTALVRPLK